MKSFYLVLVFSSLILINTIPTYAQETTFNELDSAWSRVSTTNTLGTACSTTWDHTDQGVTAPILPRFSATNDCWFSWVEFDVSSIPDDVTVTDTVLTLTTSGSWRGTPRNCDIEIATLQPSINTGQDVLTDILAKTTTVLDNDNWCTTIGAKSIDLTSLMDSEIETALSSGEDYIALYITFDDMTRPSSDIWFESNLSHTSTALSITYIANEDTTPPIITLTGDNPQTIELGNGYTELGATTDDGSSVVIDSSEFEDAVGSYTISYTSTDSSNNESSTTRTVNVVDTTPPIITLTGANPQSIELGNGYDELGATTDDGSSVVIDSSEFEDAVGSYTISYTSTDSSNNESSTTRTVNVVDTTPPIITLTGDNPQSIELGNGYDELGATTDDGSSVVIDSSAFTDSIGTYSITYNSVDSSGNNAVTKTRTVEVVDTTTPDITPPIITAPANIAAESTEELTTVTLVLATATDDRDPSPIITNNAPDSFPYGTTTITWTATDDSGNQSTITSTVTISDPRKPTQGETPLNELDQWIVNHGGIYFGMGIFTFGFIIIGVMASPKTVPIFTIILVILAGLLHATGIFILPAWFWGIAIIMTITLVLKRKK